MLYRNRCLLLVSVPFSVQFDLADLCRHGERVEQSARFEPPEVERAVPSSCHTHLVYLVQAQATDSAVVS
jgi:predicted secreted Zn-dependent protease